jgi:NAD(P)-dependent dehydrogenase (short-subunit alcohol dehydrogenase family)
MTTHPRRAVVLGGSGGIGLATGELLAARGSSVTLVGRHADRLATAAGVVPGAETAVADATDVASLTRLFAELGAFDDLVITVTARGGFGPIATLDRDGMAAAFAGKTVAHLTAIALALDTLAPRGSITLVTAGSAQAAFPGTALLAAVNGALEVAVPTLARELAPRRVNAVSPGVIATSWWDELPAEQREAAFRQYAEQAPAGRNGTAEDVAHLIVALIENTFTTGVVVPCDGGLRLTA